MAAWAWSRYGAAEQAPGFSNLLTVVRFTKLTATGSVCAWLLNPGAGCPNDRRPEHQFLAEELLELRRRVVEHGRQAVVVQALGDRGIGQRLGHHSRHLGDDRLRQ